MCGGGSDAACQSRPTSQPGCIMGTWWLMGRWRAGDPPQNAAQGWAHPWPWLPWSGVVSLCHIGLTTWPSTQRCARSRARVTVEILRAAEYGCQQPKSSTAAPRRARRSGSCGGLSRHLRFLELLRPRPPPAWAVASAHLRHSHHPGHSASLNSFCLACYWSLPQIGANPTGAILSPLFDNFSELACAGHSWPDM